MNAKSRPHTWGDTAYDGDAVWSDPDAKPDSTNDVESALAPSNPHAPEHEAIARHRATLLDAARSRRPVYVESRVRGRRCCAQGFVGAVHETAVVVILNQTSESILKLAHVRYVEMFRAPRGGVRGETKAEAAKRFNEGEER